MALWAEIIFIGIGALLAIWLLVAAVRTRRPVRNMLGSTVQGACALAAVNVTGALTGVSLGLNWLSCVACVALGVPGIIGLLLLKLICGI